MTQSIRNWVWLCWGFVVPLDHSLDGLLLLELLISNKNLRWQLLAGINIVRRRHRVPGRDKSLRYTKIPVHLRVVVGSIYMVFRAFLAADQFF